MSNLNVELEMDNATDTIVPFAVNRGLRKEQSDQKEAEASKNAGQARKTIHTTPASHAIFFNYMNGD